MKVLYKILGLYTVVLLCSAIFIVLPDLKSPDYNTSQDTLYGIIAFVPGLIYTVWSVFEK